MRRRVRPQVLLGILLAADALQFHTERTVSSLISGQVVDVHPRPENLRSLQRDAGQGIEVHLTELGQPREEWQAGISDLQASVEVDLLKGFHAAENLQASVGDHLRGRPSAAVRKPSVRKPSVTHRFLRRGFLLRARWACTDLRFIEVSSANSSQ
jgi:hypothetical protein